MTADGRGPDTSAARDPLSRRERDLRRARAAERVWFGVLAFVAVVVLLASGIVLVSAHPRSCAACHGDAIASAAESAHPAVACEGCHAGTGVVGLLQGRMAVIDMVAASVVPARTPVVPDVPSGLCLGCHEAMVPTTVVVGTLRMNHRAPVAEGWECRVCHPGTGHEVASALGGYTMDMCLSCHTATPVNLASCEVCHIEETATRSATRENLSPWRITHGANWRSTHGMGDLSTCSGCHDAGYCVRCHGANVPHPPNYLALHGRDVAAREDAEALCLTCHRDSACMECHGLEMPHPSGFLQAHAEEIRASTSELDDVCSRCHSQESCDACHVRHTHPGLTQQRIDALRSRPVR